MNLPLHFLVDGFLAGTFIALPALGVVIGRSATLVLPLDLAATYVLAPYFLWTCLQAGLPWFLSILGAGAACAATGALLEVGNHWPLYRDRRSASAQLIASLGLYLAAAHLAPLIWGEGRFVFLKGPGPWRPLVLGVPIQLSMPVIAAAVLVATLAVVALLRMTRAHAVLVALADNPTELALRGWNLRLLRTAFFSLASLLCGTGAVLAALALGFDSNAALHAMLLAIGGAILGGYRSLLGALLGAFGLAYLRAAVVWTFSPRWQDLVTFFVVIVILIWRPFRMRGVRP